MMTSSETNLFTISVKGDARERAEKALEAIDCYLAPTATRGTQAVTCSGRYAHQASAMSAKAADALRHAGVKV
jgi:hypothetical protein